MKKIPLTKGMFAIVDDEDFERINQHRWYYTHGYARRDSKISGKRFRIYMHRIIIGSYDGILIDHIDGNSLNNVRSNLRHSTNTENVRSQRKSLKRCKSSIYKGVSFDGWRKLFCARIMVDRKGKFLGRFSNEKQAALAYNNAAKKYFGKFAVLNNVA